MEYTTEVDKGANKLTGILFIILFFVLLLFTLTSIHIKTDINGIHDSFKYLSENITIYIVNTIIQLICIIAFIALSASLFLNLRSYHNTLSHFVAFGIAATGLTLMVSTSGSLSLINITREYMGAKDFESDIIAIDGLTIAELRKNALLITYTLEGLSLILLGVYNLTVKHIHKSISYTTFILGVFLILFEWLYYNTLSFTIIRYLTIINYLVVGYLFFKKKD